jgi:hypothetical protein
MLLGKDNTYFEDPFESESELEDAILEISQTLFGESRVYLPIKKKIGAKGKTRNIPDGYLIDLSSAKQPRLYVVENELAEHDPLKHVAVQILEFSLSFETSPHTIKNILKNALVEDKASFSICQDYAEKNGLENVDVLLERIVYGEDRFNALVIIDELEEELEKVLISRFQFPVEILTLERYGAQSGERLYRFQPFLMDVQAPEPGPAKVGPAPPDPSELDTIVVPAREDGFKEVFLGENRWYQIRIHSSMIPKIKYIAAYQIAPVSAITHVAPVSSIEQWKDTSKYMVNFTEPASNIGPIPLVPKSRVKALQAPRYTVRTRLDGAKNMDEAF